MDQHEARALALEEELSEAHARVRYLHTVCTETDGE